MQTAEVEEAKPKPITIFGFPIIQSKCERDGYLTGIIGGIGTGLVAFLFTSNPKKSTHYGFGGFVVVTLGYTINCMYNEYKMKKEIKLIKKALSNANRKDADLDAEYTTI